MIVCQSHVIWLLGPGGSEIAEDLYGYLHIFYRCLEMLRFTRQGLVMRLNFYTSMAFVVSFSQAVNRQDMPAVLWSRMTELGPIVEKASFMWCFVSLLPTL